MYYTDDKILALLLSLDDDLPVIEVEELEVEYLADSDYENDDPADWVRVDVGVAA